MSEHKRGEERIMRVTEIDGERTSWVDEGELVRCADASTGETDEDAVVTWNARAERTCRKVPGKMHYGERRPKCSECGYGLGDSRWIFCPQCGAKVAG